MAAARAASVCGRRYGDSAARRWNTWARGEEDVLRLLKEGSTVRRVPAAATRDSTRSASASRLLASLGIAAVALAGAVSVEAPRAPKARALAHVAGLARSLQRIFEARREGRAHRGVGGETSVPAMPLSAPDVKTLLRFQMMAAELAHTAEKATTVQQAAAVSVRLDAVMDELGDVLQGADPELAAEFRKTVTEGPSSPAALGPRAAALVGWIKGAVEAEKWEIRVKAGAEAYAKARIREERKTGSW